MLKKNPLLLSTNDNKLNLSHLSEINQGIISLENFDNSLILIEKDLNLFYLILKLTDNNSLTMIDFIAKNTKKEFKKKEIEKRNEFKIFLLKQLFLLFKYLSLNEEINPKKYYDLFTELYHLIFKVHNSLKITQINDIIEIIRYNIIISLGDLINQNYIFNSSINFLIDFYKNINNTDIKDEKEINILNISLIKLFETLYNHLLRNKKSLHYLQRYKDVQNLSLFNIIIFYNNNTENNEDENIKKINDFINKILLLVYSFNSSKLINDIILSDIKEGFFELKKGNDTVIKNIINLLSNKIHLVNSIYLNEKDTLKNDLYQPKNYFVFNNSLYSGIDYDPQFDLFNYNFALLFSFKISDNKNNCPLISFLSEENQNNEIEILLNISLQNKRIGILFQNEHQEFSNIEIQSNKSYLIIIEYFKNDVGFEKLKLIINNVEERKYINLGLIDYDKNVFIKLGYLTEKIRLQSSSLENLSLNFSGIMGPVLIFPDIYNEFKDDIINDENDLATHFSRLKGFYDNIIYINKNCDLDYLYIYENFKLISDQRFIKASIYLNEIANKSGRKEYYIISPLSIINAVDHNSKKFIDNLNGFSKITKNAYIDTFYSTLEVPSNKTEATYAKLNINSLQSFVQYEGLHLLTLILEYHYNLLRMIIDDSQYENKLSIAFDINNALIPIINLMTNIIMFFQINLFSKELDTFGFSLMKVINLLGDIKALNSSLINCIIDNTYILLNFYNENIANTKISQIVRNFINKIFSLINNPKYYDSDNFEQMKKIFRLFHEILINNYDLMTSDTFVSILQFCFVLDIEIDEDDDEKEFKSMKGEYKSLIELIMKQNESIEFYLDYLKNVFQKNISIKIKYKLMKIYYKSNEVVSVLNNDLNEEKNDKIENKENKDGKDKSFWKIFKSKKEDEKASINMTNGDDLITRYDIILTKILAIRFLNNPMNEKYHELLKCIMIQLTFEQAVYLYKKNSEDKYCFFSEECILKKQNDIIQGTNVLRDMIHPKSRSIKELAKLRKSSHLPDGFKTTFSSIFGTENEKKNSSVLYLFDKLLESNSISFYVIKSLFCCLFDKWDRNDKFNFFKNNTDIKYESFDANFGNFTKNKKVLISDFIDLITCINNQETMKKSMNLIFSFLRKCISDFKSIKDDKNIQIYNIKYYKKKFYHIFESKTIMNKLFNFCLLKDNKYISEDLRESLLVNLINICNNVMEYHPRPFIFHFMKSSIKNKDIRGNIYPIFKGISEYIINNLKKDTDIVEKEKSELSIEDSINKGDSLLDKDDKSDNEEIYSYLYYNEIRFLKCIIKIYKNNQFEIQKLLSNNDFKFLNSLLNLIIGFCSSKIIYDLKLYIFHPNSLIQDSKEKLSFNSSSNSTMSMMTSNSKDDEKMKDKYDIKLIQSSESKTISNQIFFLNLMELIYLTIYFLCTFPVDENEANNQKILNHFIKAIFEKICIDDHFITYYLDILNQKNYAKIAQKENIPSSTISKCLEEIPFKYYHWIIKNSAVKDNRLFCALLFLKILKYQNLLKIYQKNKPKENNPRVEIIKNMLSNHINLAQNDLISISQIIEKIKDSKKVEAIFEKEELNNKDFKNFHRNYYKYLMSYINKFKNTESFDYIKNDLEKKFIKEEEEKKSMKINWINNNFDANDSNNSLEESISEIKLARNDEDYISLSKMNNSGEKNTTKRKDSYNNYYKDEIDASQSRSRKPTSDYIATISTNNLYGAYETVSFIDLEEPVLCTKRDLVLKYFGYYFFDEYFKDERFIKMKNYFMHLYPTTNVNNNYNGFEKQMKINYPSVLKNYSSCNNYYPRIFLRPDHIFFQNENLNKSHEYLNVNESNSSENKNDNNNNENINIYNYITNEKENRILHFENGHGLLNQNNFNLFTAGNIKENLGISYEVFECEYINNKNTIQGNIKLIRNFIVFQTNQNFDFSLYETNRKYRISSRKEEIYQIPKQVIIPINLIEQVILRNFLFYCHAIEIFLYNGKSYFFNFYETAYCNDFINNLKIQYENCYINNLGDIFEVIDNPIEYFNKKKYCNNWLEGKLSTLDYLLLINKFSGRSYNDLTQYIIFPWLLNDYSDVNNKNNFRKMNLSMAIQDKTNLESIKESYENDKDLIKRSHFQYHYSNSSYISLYLLRLNPFTYNQIKQNGHFDSPDRQLESMQDMCIIFKDFKETSELIPEYFFMAECFLNLNYNFFGKKSNEIGREQSIVNNIKLTSNFSSLLELILFHQNFINSNEITGNVNKWIDIIFGENQLTNKKNVINSYPIDCYEKYVKEEIDQKVNELNECEAEDSEGITNKIKKLIKDIKLKTDYAYLFGQCPPQIFQKTHPIFSMLKKSKRATVNYDDNALKMDTKITIPDKQILYLSYKNGNNNLYILTSNKILVYNKALKQIYSFEINKFNQPYLLDIDDNELFLRFLYKNLIFEIEDCRIFFIGGYLDNSFKIYYKEKEKDNNDKETLSLSILTESQVTCIKNICGKNIFYTGHKNGKIMKWKYNLLSEKLKSKQKDDCSIGLSSIININKKANIIGHKSFVQIIDTNDNFNVLISTSNDGFIFIRKIFDYELLNVIKYNPFKKSLFDLCFDKQFIIATYYNKKNNQKRIKINTYSLNGIKLSDEEQNISLPFILNQKTDEIVVFINGSIYKMKITFKEWEDLLIKFEKNIDGNGAETDTKKFIHEIKQNIPVSLCYDDNLKNIFCLFKNGQLYRINMKL